MSMYDDYVPDPPNYRPYRSTPQKPRQPSKGVYLVHLPTVIKENVREEFLLYTDRSLIDEHAHILYKREHLNALPIRRGEYQIKELKTLSFAAMMKELRRAYAIHNVLGDHDEY